MIEGAGIGKDIICSLFYVCTVVPLVKLEQKWSYLERDYLLNDDIKKKI